MYKGSRSRFFPVIVILVVIAIVVFAFVSIGRFVIGSLVGNGGQSTQTSQQTTAENNLLATDGGASVQISVRGPIVGDEQFRSYQITISPTSRSIVTWSGYDQNNVIDQKSLDNNQKAYDQFVHALDYAGFAKSRSASVSNTSGLCANGRIYHFDIMTNSVASQDTWTTNCGQNGTFDGDGPTVRALFLEQIDGADNMVGKVGL